MLQLPAMQDVGQLAAAWRTLVASASPTLPARLLYQGRSIVDTSFVAEHLGSDWYIVSAGLGLIRSDQLVPSYNCTVAAGSELHSRLKTSGGTAATWWNEITVGSPQPLSRLISRSPCLLALPSTYLHMVHDDLAQVPNAKAEQLRIFTSPAGAALVPKHLVTCVLPYDDRLESVTRYAGTQTDFAQRALRHFVEALEAVPLSLEAARAAVSAVLVPQPRRSKSVGRRMSDEEIRQVLNAQWERHGGRSTLLLRYLRDEARISCEQKRFSRIWQALAAERREGRLLRP